MNPDNSNYFKNREIAPTADYFTKSNPPTLTVPNIDIYLDEADFSDHLSIRIEIPIEIKSRVLTIQILLSKELLTKYKPGLFTSAITFLLDLIQDKLTNEIKYHLGDVKLLVREIFVHHDLVLDMNKPFKTRITHLPDSSRLVEKFVAVDGRGEIPEYAYGGSWTTGHVEIDYRNIYDFKSVIESGEVVPRLYRLLGISQTFIPKLLEPLELKRLEPLRLEPSVKLGQLELF